MSNSLGNKNIHVKLAKQNDQLRSQQNIIYQNTLKILPKIARKSISNFPNSLKTFTAQKNFEEDNTINLQEQLQSQGDVKSYISKFIKPLKHMRVSPDMVLKRKLKTEVNHNKKKTKKIHDQQSQTIHHQSKRYSFLDEESVSLSPNGLLSIYSNPMIENMHDNIPILKNSNHKNNNKSLQTQNQTKHKIMKQTVKHFLLPPLSKAQINQNRRASYQKTSKYNHINAIYEDSNLMTIAQSMNQKRNFNKNQFYIQEADEQEENNEQYQAPIGKIKKNRIQQKKTLNNELSQHFDQQTYFVQLSEKQPSQKLKQSSVKSYKTFNYLTIYKIPTKQQLPKFIQDYKPINQNFNLVQLSQNANFRIIRFKNGIYIGETQENKRHGKGLFISQKTIFQGDFLNNFKSKGTQCTSEGVYQGEYINGLRQGLGQFKWNNNQIYKGQWKNGLKHGKGIWKNQNGSYYDGEWINNRQEGYGVHFHQGNLFKGNFKNFLKHGEGQQTFPNGDCYNGLYSEGRPNGYGEYTWKSGKKYIGQFKDGLRDGQGIIQQNGNIYKGQFKNDCKHGIGQITYKDGTIFKGIFEGNKIIQEGIYYDKNGKISLL